MLPLQEIASKLIEGIQPVAGFINSEFGSVTVSDAEEKSRNSLVSRVDVTAEKMLVELLSKILPEAGFVTEEDTVDKTNTSLYWVIDPLDGTSNFLFGIPVVSISVALKQDHVAVLGLVHHVNMGDTYHAILGHGAFKNRKPIKVSARQTIAEAMVATGFPYKPEHFLDTQLKLIEFFVLKARGVRRLGSAALDLAYVAEGVFDIYFESGLNEWDTSAGMLLVREAGGICSDLDGDQAYQEGIHVLATTAALHAEVLQLIKKFR